MKNLLETCRDIQLNETTKIRAICDALDYCNLVRWLVIHADDMEFLSLIERITKWSTNLDLGSKSTFNSEICRVFESYSTGYAFVFNNDKTRRDLQVNQQRGWQNSIYVV